MAKKKSSKDEVIVSEKEIETQIKKDKHKDKKKDEVEDSTPSWYHYVIVLLVFFGGFYAIYLVFDYFDDEKPGTIIKSKTYLYPHKVGNITYNIYFHSPIDELKELNYPINVNKYDMFSTWNVKFSFLEYNGTDNGRVTIASTKMVSFFKLVYTFKFNANESFVEFKDVNCLNSTVKERVIVLNPYSDRNGVFVNESNGCINIESIGADNFVQVADSFIYELTK